MFSIYLIKVWGTKTKKWKSQSKVNRNRKRQNSYAARVIDRDRKSCIPITSVFLQINVFIFNFFFRPLGSLIIILLWPSPFKVIY